jgi:hypothetical protein
MKIRSSVVAALLLHLGAPALPQEGSTQQRLPYEGTLQVAATYGLVDVSCILSSWKILGALACPTPEGGVRVCVLVENAYPTGILEVVRQEYRSHYAEMSGTLSAMQPATPPGSSASATARTGGGDALQFSESRVYTFVPDLGLSNSDIPLAIPSSQTFQVDYVSELDGWGWRNPLLEKFVAPESILSGLKSCDRIPDCMSCAGRWGSYFPRVGAIEHPSQVTGAHMQALRGGRVASMPVGRVVLSTYSYEPRTGHYIQMIKPSYRTCLSIGSPLITLWEKGAGSSYGAYAFIHFGLFMACNGCLPVTLEPAREPAY